MDKKIVVIGGGTGLSVILRGLKKITEELTAIVSVADDGGSSGILREDLGMLPPGDIRSCIIALADTEPVLQSLFNYRFKAGLFENQSLGNLMIAALEDLSGSFENAIQMASDIFAINGRVLPVTTDKVHIKGMLSNGRTVIGESKLPFEALKSASRIVEVELVPSEAMATPSAINAIIEADVVVIGPGSLYTSIIPNLLVNGVTKALQETKASVVYVANLMTQPGETDSYLIRDHLEAIENHVGTNIFDYVILNSKKLDETICRLYMETGSKQILRDDRDVEYFEKHDIIFVEGDFVEVVKNYSRHNFDEISQKILTIINSKTR